MCNLVNQWVFYFSFNRSTSKGLFTRNNNDSKAGISLESPTQHGQGLLETFSPGTFMQCAGSLTNQISPFPPFYNWILQGLHLQKLFVLFYTSGHGLSRIFFFFQTSPCSLASTSFLGGTLQFGGQVAVWKKMPCNTLEWSSSRPSTVNITLAAGDWFLTLTFRKKVSTFCSHITAASCPEEMSLAYPSAQMGTRPVWLGSLFDFLLDFSCVLSCFFHVCNAQPSPLSIHCVCSHMSGGRALSWAGRLFPVDVGVIIWREAPSLLHHMTHHW